MRPWNKAHAYVKMAEVDWNREGRRMGSFARHTSQMMVAMTPGIPTIIGASTWGLFHLNWMLAHEMPTNLTSPECQGTLGMARIPLAVPTNEGDPVSPP